MLSTTFIMAVDAAGQDTTIRDTILGFLPIVVFLVILYFIFRRTQKSPVAKLQREYLQRQIEFMPRIEASLERIARALEHGTGSQSQTASSHVADDASRQSAALVSPDGEVP